MKQLAKGSGQSGWAVQTVCSGEGWGGGGCGAKFLVEEGDLFTWSPNSPGGKVSYQCQDCGVLTSLGVCWGGPVPGYVRDRLREVKDPGRLKPSKAPSAGSAATLTEKPQQRVAQRCSQFLEAVGLPVAAAVVLAPADEVLGAALRELEGNHTSHAARTPEARISEMNTGLAEVFHLLEDARRSGLDPAEGYVRQLYEKMRRVLGLFNKPRTQPVVLSWLDLSEFEKEVTRICS